MPPALLPPTRPLQVLLQLYEPLLLSRVKRVQGQQKHTDSRELMAAARQGLLRAAARFDPQRVTQGRDRLYALAERYIQMALRDVLTEVRGKGRRGCLDRACMHCSKVPKLCDTPAGGPQVCQHQAMPPAG